MHTPGRTCQSVSSFPPSGRDPLLLLLFTALGLHSHSPPCPEKIVSAHPPGALLHTCSCPCAYRPEERLLHLPTTVRHATHTPTSHVRVLTSYISPCSSSHLLTYIFTTNRSPRVPLVLVPISGFPSRPSIRAISTPLPGCAVSLAAAVPRRLWPSLFRSSGACQRFRADPERALDPLSSPRLQDPYDQPGSTGSTSPRCFRTLCVILTSFTFRPPYRLLTTSSAFW